jgi:hypothetical protein
MYKLFKNSNTLINNKEIYISYNILVQPITQDRYYSHHDYEDYNSTSRLCFIEFNDYILIEKELIGINYYINKLPVYDFNGILMDPKLSINNQYELTINPVFKKMLGMKFLIEFNTSSDKIKEVVDSLTVIGNVILFYYSKLTNKSKRYSLSKELLDSFIILSEQINYYKKKINTSGKSNKILKYFNEDEFINNNIHNTDEKDNIYHVDITLLNYDYNFELNSNGYINEPFKVEYCPLFNVLKIIYCNDDYRRNEINTIFNREKVFNMKGGINNIFYKKYLKYKNKYNNLKAVI